MTRFSTAIQLWIHRQYDNIKLVLQFVIIGLIIIMMVNANIISERLTRHSDESTAEIIDRIDRETQRQSEEIKRQTEQLNSQFQALCFIVIQVAGEDALRQIDPPLEDQCKAITAEMQESAAQQQAQPQSTPAPQSNAAPVPTTDPEPPVDSRTPDQVEPDPPVNDNRSWLLGGVDNLLHGLGL